MKSFAVLVFDHITIAIMRSFPSKQKAYAAALAVDKEGAQVAAIISRVT